MECLLSRAEISDSVSFIAEIFPQIGIKIINTPTLFHLLKIKKLVNSSIIFSQQNVKHSGPTMQNAQDFEISTPKIVRYLLGLGSINIVMFIISGSTHFFF